MIFPNKKYDIVYADPPWDECGGGKIRRGADKHYPLMSTEDIMNMPVRNITKKNCHLYLWVTNNHLQDGFKVMKRWGFEYKTMVTWVKDKCGLGQYFRGQTEHCLFGVKGMIPYKTHRVTSKRYQATTVFSAKRTTHSTKPNKMRKIIEHVSDRKGFDKIELFARERFDGWDYYNDKLLSRHPTISIEHLSNIQI